MDKEYVEREAVIAETRKPRLTDAELRRRLALLPAADVRPVVRGKWKKHMEEKETPYYKLFTPVWSCSECGTEYDPSLGMTINFCTNCGALMEDHKE